MRADQTWDSCGQKESSASATCQQVELHAGQLERDPIPHLLLATDSGGVVHVRREPEGHHGHVGGGRRLPGRGKCAVRVRSQRLVGLAPAGEEGRRRKRARGGAAPLQRALEQFISSGQATTNKAGADSVVPATTRILSSPHVSCRRDTRMYHFVGLKQGQHTSYGYSHAKARPARNGRSLISAEVQSAHLGRRHGPRGP